MLLRTLCFSIQGMKFHLHIKIVVYSPVYQWIQVICRLYGHYCSKYCVSAWDPKPLCDWNGIRYFMNCVCIMVSSLLKRVQVCIHPRILEIILSQRGKGHTRGNLPISVLPSNKHIHIDTHTILYVMHCDCEHCG